MRFCVVLACSTSPTSSVNKDWVTLDTSLDFEVMHRQTRFSESVPRRGAVTDLRKSGRPPTTWIHQICRDTGVTATEVLQLAEGRRFWRTIATAGGFGWSLCGVWWWWKCYRVEELGLMAKCVVLWLTLLTMVALNCDRSYIQSEHSTICVRSLIISLRFQLSNWVRL